MRRNTRKLMAVILVVIALGALSVVMAASAGAGGTQVDEPCDVASANNPACVQGKVEINNPGNPGDPADPGDVVGTAGGQLAVTGGDILLLSIFALVAIGAGAFVVANRRRHAAVNAEIE